MKFIDSKYRHLFFTPQLFTLSPKESIALGLQVNYKKKRNSFARIPLSKKTAMATRSHSVACDDGTIMFPKECEASTLPQSN